MVTVSMMHAHHVPVIPLPLLRIREHAVGLAYLRKTLACVGVVAVEVWMCLLGKGVELLLQLCLRGMLSDPKHFVVVRSVTVAARGAIGLGEVALLSACSVDGKTFGRPGICEAETRECARPQVHASCL